MFQNQYYNRNLTKEHIEKILTNYNIKYNTMKNEIDAKFNSMIKLFINDIKAFLENIEEISTERKKIKEAENKELELAILKNKLEEKNRTENALRNQVELLTKENERLEKKIKLKEKIIKNNKISLETSRTDIKVNPSRKKTNKLLIGTKTARKDKSKNFNLSIDTKTEEKRLTTNRFTHKSNKSYVNFDKNIISETSKYEKTLLKTKKKTHNSMDKRIIKKKTATIKKNLMLKEKSQEIKSAQETKSTSNNQQGKNKLALSDEKLSTVEMPFSEPSYAENESITTDELLDDEIKELEMEEENIILLMDKIKQLNENI